MKAIFITYNQAYYSEIVEAIEEAGVRGYTQWPGIRGRGSVDGEPHEGSHAWPTHNDAVLTFVPDDKVAPILAMMKEKDEAAPALGLRCFVWNIEQRY